MQDLPAKIEVLQILPFLRYNITNNSSNGYTKPKQPLRAVLNGIFRAAYFFMTISTKDKIPPVSGAAVILTEILSEPPSFSAEK